MTTKLTRWCWSTKTGGNCGTVSWWVKSWWTYDRKPSKRRTCIISRSLIQYFPTWLIRVSNPGFISIGASSSESWRNSVRRWSIRSKRSLSMENSRSSEMFSSFSWTLRDRSRRKPRTTKNNCKWVGSPKKRSYPSIYHLNRQYFQVLSSLKPPWMHLCPLYRRKSFHCPRICPFKYLKS